VRDKDKPTRREIGKRKEVNLSQRTTCSAPVSSKYPSSLPIPKRGRVGMPTGPGHYTYPPGHPIVHCWFLRHSSPCIINLSASEDHRHPTVSATMQPTIAPKVAWIAVPTNHAPNLPEIIFAVESSHNPQHPGFASFTFSSLCLGRA
jgi:hypothetical protein